VNYNRIREALPFWTLVPGTRASTWIERTALYPPYRAEIDGLRALAVVPVVLYHAGFDVFRGGFVGVDAFFVISGYLITGNVYTEISAKHFSLIDFYERRIRRILPALYLVLFLCLPFAWLWIFPWDFVDFGRSLVSVCLFASNIFFNGQIDYFTPSTETWPLIHTWSLAVEEQFYVLLPILLILSRRSSRTSLIALMIAISAVSLGWADWDSRQDPQSDFYLLPSRAWELGFGATVALLTLDKLPVDRRLADALAWAGFALLAYSILDFRPDMPLPSLRSIWPVGGTALLIAFATDRTTCGKWLGSRPLVLIGLISYSAYLWHQPLFAFARYRFNAQPDGPLLLSLSAASFAVAYASWRFVERPFRDRKRIPRSTVLVAAALTGVVLIVAGRSIVIQRGFPARMPAIEGSKDFGRYRDGCIDINDLSPDNLVEMSACQLGDREAKLDFLLIGDSHAAALADGINAAALRQGRHGMIIASKACLPIFGVPGQYPHSRDACRRLHDNIISIIDHSAISLVLLHARWDAFDDKGLLGALDLKSQSPRQFLYDRVTDTLSALNSHHVRAVIITSTPRAPFRVPDILARKEQYGLSVEERPRFLTFLNENTGASFIFDDQKIRERANIFDLYPFFCRPSNGGFCEVAEHGRPYFYDENHLSYFGSLALSHLEEEIFK
jgi:peptidoglycan/LPS O-acetylase OafA/YrhL